MFYIQLLWFPVFVGWPYIENILWDSVIQPLWSQAGCSRYLPCVGYLGYPVVFGSWLLISHLWVKSPLRLADCKAQSQSHLASCYTCAVCCRRKTRETSMHYFCLSLKESSFYLFISFSPHQQKPRKQQTQFLPSFKMLR